MHLVLLERHRILETSAPRAMTWVMECSQRCTRTTTCQVLVTQIFVQGHAFHVSNLRWSTQFGRTALKLRFSLLVAQSSEQLYSARAAISGRSELFRPLFFKHVYGKMMTCFSFYVSKEKDCMCALCNMLYIFVL